MIKETIDATIELLKEIPWLATGSDVFGLVRADVKSGKDQDGRPFRNILPVACNINTGDCSPGKAAYVSPDTKKNAVIWFEDLGTRPNQQGSGNKQSWLSAFRLVCWMNSVKFTTDYCNLSEIAIRNIVDALTSQALSNGQQVKITSIPAKDYAVITKWSFPVTSGFTSSDFDFFHIDLAVIYMQGTCSDVLTLKNDACS